MTLHIEPYGNRFYALYDGDELVCVTVYKKGREGGQEEIRSQPHVPDQGR